MIKNKNKIFDFSFVLICFAQLNFKKNNAIIKISLTNGNWKQLHKFIFFPKKCRQEQMSMIYYRLTELWSLLFLSISIKFIICIVEWIFLHTKKNRSNVFADSEEMIKKRRWKLFISDFLRSYISQWKWESLKVTESTQTCVMLNSYI